MAKHLSDRSQFIHRSAFSSTSLVISLMLVFCLLSLVWALPSINEALRVRQMDYDPRLSFSDIKKIQSILSQQRLYYYSDLSDSQQKINQKISPLTPVILSVNWPSSIQVKLNRKGLEASAPVDVNDINLRYQTSFDPQKSLRALYTLRQLLEKHHLVLKHFEIDQSGVLSALLKGGTLIIMQNHFKASLARLDRLLGVLDKEGKLSKLDRIDLRYEQGAAVRFH